MKNVRVGDMTFADRVSLPMRKQYTDTFIFRMTAYACIPPFNYAPLLERMTAHVRQKRSCASLWVQVDSPGEWFVLEVQKSLKGLKIAHAVTRVGHTIDYADFSYPPVLLSSRLPDAPVVEVDMPEASDEELKCLQALGRMKIGSGDEIASLAGLSVDSINDLLTNLQERKLVTTKASPDRKKDKPKSKQLDFFPSWRLTQKGLFVALRSWGAPLGTDFSSRTEEHPTQIGTVHRYRARMWLALLRAAFPQAEFWTGWSEVRLPETTVIPDGLAWGRIGDHETLFWLEVGDEHKSREKITKVTKIRLQQAVSFCGRTGVNLVYTQLGPRWVLEAVRWACSQLPSNVAVLLGDHRRFGELPLLEWGKITKINPQEYCVWIY